MENKERDLTVVTGIIMKMNDTQKAQTRAELTTKGYTNLDTDEGLIDAYDLNLRSAGTGMGALTSVVGLILIIIVIVAMFA